MSQFIDPLVVKEIDDSIFQTVNIFRYQSGIAGLITVPAGFYTDFASVPRWMPVMYALLGDTAHEPAVIHDWLYYSAIEPRELADKVLLEAMEAWGMPAWRYYPIYWGVRTGGWAAWNKHRKDGHPEDGKFKDSPDITPASPSS